MSCNAQDLINLAYASDRLAKVSERDLLAIGGASTCGSAGKITPPCVTPSTPGTPTVFQSLDTILKIRWTQPINTGSFITSYTVNYGTTAGGPYTNSVTVALGGKQAILTGLTSGTTYYFTVTANSFSGCSSAASAEGSGATTGTPPIDPAVTAWEARVIANGGADPSAATLTAADTFWKGIKADGLDGLIIALNFFAPDNLIAAITPFIKGPGNDPWTNHNFLAGDIGIGGLLGNGTTKYLQTGVIPNTAVANNNDIGYTIYGMSGGTSPQNTMIARDGAANIAGIWSQAFIAQYNAWDFTPVVSAGAGVYGWISSSRTGAAAEAWYQANSIIGFTVGGSAVTAPATRPTVEFYLYCWNQNGGTSNFNGAPVTVSFCAIHHGLTQAQSQAFFNRIQTLRTAFGGGFS